MSNNKQASWGTTGLVQRKKESNITTQKRHCAIDTFCVITVLCAFCALTAILSACNRECRHGEWEESKCVSCGILCAHRQWHDGACVLCGSKCAEHDWDADGYCLICGAECEHEYEKNGICSICSSVCLHLNRDEVLGICKDCGMDCTHGRHDIEGRCVACGKAQVHKYNLGVCSCGKVIPYETDKLPDELWELSAQQGTLTDNVYESHDYTRGMINGEYPTLYKHMTVYTPYGYTKDKKYDVVFMLPGTNMNEQFFWKAMSYGDDRNIELKTMLDNMIAGKLCDELIVVGINYFSGNGDVCLGMGTDSIQLGSEFVNDILPYIVENYSTYAASGIAEDLSAVREHFGFIGASYGAIEMYYSLGSLFDFCAWFGGISGGAVSAQAISDWIDDSPYTLKALYMCAGDKDFLLNQTYDEYRDLNIYSAKCEAGKNMIMQTIAEAGHEGKVWVNGIYNCLLTFFAAGDKLSSP